MNKFMRTAIQAVFGIFLATTAQAGDRCVIPDGANEMVQRMAVVVNETRGQLNRGQMRYNATLSQSAQGHACDMAINGFFDHHGRNGSTPGQRAKQAGYRYCQIAENLTYGAIYRSPEQAMGAWLNSPGHLANLRLRDVTEFGLGLAGDLRNPYWVLVVAKPC